MLTKDQLPDRIATPRTLIRRTTPADFSEIRAWPPYPWPVESYSMTSPQSVTPDLRYWWMRLERPERCHYSVIHAASGGIIGVLTFSAIDWALHDLGNMGVRVRADFCDQGYGFEALSALLQAALRAGARRIRLDVAASNSRAVRLYEKCGMRIAGEFWQPHHGAPVDPLDPRWNFALPHLKFDCGAWLTRFYWMELTVPD